MQTELGEGPCLLAFRTGEAVFARAHCRDTPGALTDPAREAAQTLADVAAAYLISAKTRQESLQAADWFRERSLHDALKGQGPAPGTGELGSPREGDHGHPTVI